MCEFCTQHGEGKKWYLAMRNYSRELLDQAGRRGYMDRFVARFEEDTARAFTVLNILTRYPMLWQLLRPMAVLRQKAAHWGQVVPIEDAEQIIDLQDSVVRLPCVCRRFTTGRTERYCLGLGAEPLGILGHYSDMADSLEVLEREEAKALLRTFDRQGMMHSVWTFRTPFIGGLCNCDQDCMAYRTQVRTGVMQVMFRAEYVAAVDWELCSGCRKCVKQCQFGAIAWSASQKRPTIDLRACYGCGVCRATCPKEAIGLRSRSEMAGLSW